MVSSTGSLHPFEELDMPDNDKFESENNIDVDEETEPFGKFFYFSQLVEGGTVNTVEQTDDADGTRVETNAVGKLVASTTSNYACMGTIALRKSSTSNSSKKWRVQARRNVNNASTLHLC